MKAISKMFGDIFMPQKALLIYRNMNDNASVYVEAYDLDEAGKPINAHPLSIDECTNLAEALDSTDALKKDFLISTGLLPEQILKVNPTQGYAIWYTPPKEVDLLFKKELAIPCGKAKIPGMVWKADKNKLQVFTFKGTRRPSLKTTLYHAPFFNIYQDARVCMGTVDIALENCNCLEDFIGQWEDYFFNSYFSHVIQDVIVSKQNIIQLWQQQVNSGRPFPEDTLITANETIQNLIR
jgi:PRTRC genetic system protein B